MKIIRGDSFEHHGTGDIKVDKRDSSASEPWYSKLIWQIVAGVIAFVVLFFGYYLSLNGNRYASTPSEQNQNN